MLEALRAYASEPCIWQCLLAAVAAQTFAATPEKELTPVDLTARLTDNQADELLLLSRPFASHLCLCYAAATSVIVFCKGQSGAVIILCRQANVAGRA